jgi:hypothetical protein
VVDGKIEAKGKVYPSPQHGFARPMEHSPVSHTENTVVLELCASEETLCKFPYDFRLVSTFTLEDDTLHHTAGNGAHGNGIFCDPDAADPAREHAQYANRPIREWNRARECRAANRANVLPDMRQEYQRTVVHDMLAFPVLADPARARSGIGNRCGGIF